MSIITLKLTGFNNKSKYVQYFSELGENTFIFTIRWSEYCDCAFLTITDYEDNDIITGVALVNGLKIRHNKLPYVLFFTQINGETYEPTIDNIENEFVIMYDDGEDE